MQILQKITNCENVSLVIALWADIFIAYIALNPISIFLSLFYLRDLANFAGSTMIFFFIVAALVI